MERPSQFQHSEKIQQSFPKKASLPEEEPSAMLLAIVGIAGERVAAGEASSGSSSEQLEGRLPDLTNGCEKNSCVKLRCCQK